MRSNRIGILFLALLTIATAYISCQKLIGFDFPDTIPVIPVNASLSGRVTDKDHLPVEGATVRIGNVTTTTDLNGYFRLKSVTIPNPALAFVKVEKDGFFTGSRLYTATQASDSYVAIQLIKKEVAGGFNASAGGTVAVPGNGGTIVFPSNGIMNAATGVAYTGTVSVSAFFIDPSANDFQEMMPGALKGTSNTGALVGLQSYGMMAVELSGAANEKLQLADGKFATLSFPIPIALQAKAPQNIPLWSFNDTTGVWKEEGAAAKQGGNYVGTVGHFSFWNCDFPLPIINFRGTILNQDNSPMPYVKVLMKTIDDAFSTFGYGYTDSAGLISGSVPANMNLQMSVFNKCGDIVYTKNIGPFTGAANLGNHVVNNSKESKVNFTGTAVNCLGNPLADGVVSIALENNYYYTSVTNGNFSFSVSRCTNTSTVATLRAIDNAGRVQGTAVQFTVSDTLVSTGVLTACGTSVSEFLNYTFDGLTKVYTSPLDSISVSRSQTGIYNVWFSRKVAQSPYEEVNMVFGPVSSGSAPLTTLRVSQSNFTYRLPAASTLIITENGSVGEFVSGNINTTLRKDTSSSTPTLPFSGNFRFKRLY